MWELIRTNKIKSYLLVILMALFLAALGFGIGYSIDPSLWVYGVAGAGALWFGMTLTAIFAGDRLVMKFSGARKVTHDEFPRLYNVVEEMKIAGGLPKVPDIYIIDNSAPNAFATGRKPENASIAVTTGLLYRLNRYELQGVIAHEMSHIKHRDILFMTLAGVILGAVVLLSDVFIRGAVFGSRRGRRGFRSRKSGGGGGGGGGQAQAIIFAATLVLAIASPFIVRLLYLSVSRRREYLADAGAVVLTRYPDGLAGALEKIGVGARQMKKVNRAVAPMYIVNPVRSMKASGLTSSHPPIQRRIAILRAMSSGASLRDYQKAFRRTGTEKRAPIPVSGLKESKPLTIRKPDSSPDQEDTARARARQVGDYVRYISGYAFIDCRCGLRIKVPQFYNLDLIYCPRCGLPNSVPVAGRKPDHSEKNSGMPGGLDKTFPFSGMAAAAALGGLQMQKQDAQTEKSSPAPPGEPLEVTVKSSRWETVRCPCSKSHQISPGFQGDHIKCSCGRIINITRN